MGMNAKIIAIFMTNMKCLIKMFKKTATINQVFWFCKRRSRICKRQHVNKTRPCSLYK